MVDWVARNSCLFNPTEAKGRNLLLGCWMSCGPRGQEVQLAGNQEWGSLEPSCVNPSPLGLLMCPLACLHRPALSVQCTQGEGGCPSPSSETLLSLNVSIKNRPSMPQLAKCPEEKQLAQLAQMPTFVPVLRRQELGLRYVPPR